MSLVSNDNAFRSHSRPETLKHHYAIDSKRLSDGVNVIIKRVRKDTNESTIAQFLSSQSFRRDPRNHCDPVHEVFSDESEPNMKFIVMPI